MPMIPYEIKYMADVFKQQEKRIFLDDLDCFQQIIAELFYDSDLDAVIEAVGDEENFEDIDKLKELINPDGAFNKLLSIKQKTRVIFEIGEK